MRFWRQRLALLAILLGCWALLITQLGQRSLWVDEFLTAQIVQGTWQDVIAHAAADIHPPLYFLALHLWTLVAGAGDFALRWFSVACGLLSVALVPGVAARLFDARVALLATALTAISPPLIEFSRMARYYSLLVVVGLLSTRFLLDALRLRRWPYWLAYALAALALVYTFYPSAVLLVAQGLCLVLPHRRSGDLSRWFASLGFAALIFGPWFAVAAVPQIFGTASNAGVDFARSALGWLLGLAAALYTFGVGENLFPWQPFAWLGVLVVGAALLAGRHLLAWWSLAALCVISLAGMSFVTTYVSTGTPFLNVPVRALFTLPFFVMLVSAGLSSIRLLPPYIPVGLLALVWFVTNVNQLTGDQYLNPIYLTPSKEAAAFVRARLEPGDLVVSDQDSVVGRYLPPSAESPWHVYSDQRDRVLGVLTNDQPARVWLVTIGRDQSERFASAEPVRQMLASNYRLESTWGFLPIDRTYLQVKDALLRRSTYADRLTVDLYTRD